jgi:hypothetical protein
LIVSDDRDSEDVGEQAWRKTLACIHPTTAITTRWAALTPLAALFIPRLLGSRVDYIGSPL